MRWRTAARRCSSTTSTCCRAAAISVPAAKAARSRCASTCTATSSRRRGSPSMANYLRPLGALFAAVALWSIGLLVLGLAGLGGRVDRHPPNPALAPPVPVVELQSLDPRLGNASDYAEVGQRPLLNADRRPAPVAAAADAPSEAPLEATLTSVLIAGDTRIAIVQKKDDAIARRVRVGDVLEGTAWRLAELQPRRAVFEGPSGRRELEL